MIYSVHVSREIVTVVTVRDQVAIVLIMKFTCITENNKW